MKGHYVPHGWVQHGLLGAERLAWRVSRWMRTQPVGSGLGREQCKQDRAQSIWRPCWGTEWRQREVFDDSWVLAWAARWVSFHWQETRYTARGQVSLRNEELPSSYVKFEIHAGHFAILHMIYKGSPAFIQYYTPSSHVSEFQLLHSLPNTCYSLLLV